MKMMYLFPVLCCVCVSCKPEISHSEIIEHDPSIQTVTRKLQYGSSITFTVKFTHNKITGPSSLNFGPCIYDAKLWAWGVMIHPPQSILLSGKLLLNGSVIELDVSGMAHPWVNPEEFRATEARLVKYGDIDPGYVLDVGFFKGGALDYIGTWVIYQGKSSRETVEYCGDTYPDWVGKENLDNDKN